MTKCTKKPVCHTSTRLRGLRSKEGFTLVELMVVVTIVGILAAVAIPSFVTYIKNARISEAMSSIQGIIEAEQAYFMRFQRYTPSLPICPTAPAGPAGSQQVFNPALCGQDWVQLGWQPEGGVYFQYQVFTAYPADFGTNPNAVLLAPNAVLGANAQLFGVNWAINGPQLRPWFAVQAQADTDNDGQLVFLRSNSINYHIFRSPDPTVNPTW